MSNNPYGAKQVSTGQATCTGAADLLVAARASRIAVTLVNRSATTAYIGASGVTTSTGVKLNENETLTLDTVAAIYGATCSGTATIHYVEEHN